MLINFERFITSGHANNIPYGTTLNAELRNPQSAEMIRLTACIDNIALRQLGYGSNYGRDIVNVTEETGQTLKEKLNAEFKKLFPTFYPRTRYRGLCASDEVYEKFKSAKAGDIIMPDEGFAYYSKYKNVAEDFAKGGKNPVLITCKIPFWSKVSRMIFFMPQIQWNGAVLLKTGETMTPAGSRYKVIKNGMDKNGVLNIVMKLLRK